MVLFSPPSCPFCLFKAAAWLWYEQTVSQCFYPENCYICIISIDTYVLYVLVCMNWYVLICMYWYVLIYIDMQYWHVFTFICTDIYFLICVDMYWCVLIRNGIYWCVLYVLVCIGMYVRNSTWRNSNTVILDYSWIMMNLFLDIITFAYLWGKWFQPIC